MKLTVCQDSKTVVEPSKKPNAEKGFSVFRVKACGICGSDIPRVFSGASYYYPIVLGHEFSGIVEDSTDPDLVGKRACVFPILPCRKCEFCAREEWANCVKYDYYGSRRDGGMQDYLLVDERNLIFLPDNVSYEAGSMIEPTAVCLHALKKANITGDSVVTVYGAGTIGLLCAMWAKAFGAKKVCLFDVDEERMHFAASLGFESSGEECPDVVIEASGASAALNAGIEKIKAFGRIVIVGNASRDMTINKANYSRILRKQLTVFGSWNSDFRKDANEWKESVEAIANGVIDPEKLITHKIDLKNGEFAFDMIKERNEFYNKITVVM